MVGVMSYAIMNGHAMKMVRGYTLCLFAMPKWLRFL